MNVILSLFGAFILIFGFFCVIIQVVKFLFFRGGTTFKKEFKEEFDEEKIGGQIIKDEVESNQ